MNNDPRAIEAQLLLSALSIRYGYDFTDYQQTSMLHRIERFLTDNKLSNASQAIELLLRDVSLLHRLLPYLSISVTSMFRDTEFYCNLVNEVFPLLRTWPRLKIWHAGCATGEEVYSLAILLEEADLLNRTTIYATDISSSALQTAKAGVYSLTVLKNGSLNYLKAGGQGSLSNYYTTSAESGIITRRIRDRVTYGKHNLAMDASFGDMHLILCRNVLIYFNDDLKNRVLEGFHNSLENSGFLGLGKTESLCFSPISEGFLTVSEKTKIYKCIKH